MGAPKIQPTQTELDVAAVMHAVSDDEGRSHLCEPFGFQWQSRGYIAGTDGHRIAAVRSDAWQEFERERQPQIEHIINSITLKRLGEVSAANLGEECRLFPKSWDITMQFGEGAQSGLLSAVVTRKNGRGTKKIRPLGLGVSLPWIPRLEHLKRGLGVQLRYFVEAVDFCGSGTVYLHQGSELAPVVFIPYPATTLEAAPRFAFVMPVRL